MLPEHGHEQHRREHTDADSHGHGGLDDIFGHRTRILDEIGRYIAARGLSHEHSRAEHACKYEQQERFIPDKGGDDLARGDLLFGLLDALLGAEECKQREAGAKHGEYQPRDKESLGVAHPRAEHGHEHGGQYAADGAEYPGGRYKFGALALKRRDDGAHAPKRDILYREAYAPHQIGDGRVGEPAAVAAIRHIKEGGGGDKNERRREEQVGSQLAEFALGLIDDYAHYRVVCCVKYPCGEDYRARMDGVELGGVGVKYEQEGGHQGVYHAPAEAGAGEAESLARLEILLLHYLFLFLPLISFLALLLGLMGLP